MKAVEAQIEEDSDKEEGGMVEHHDGSNLKKSRLVATVPQQLQSELTIPDEDVRNLGARSFCGREPRDDIGMGAWEIRKLTGIKKDESGSLPRDLGKVEENRINTQYYII